MSKEIDQFLRVNISLNPSSATKDEVNSQKFNETPRRGLVNSSIDSSLNMDFDLLKRGVRYGYAKEFYCKF